MAPTASAWATHVELAHEAAKLVYLLLSSVTWIRGNLLETLVSSGAQVAGEPLKLGAPLGLEALPDPIGLLRPLRWFQRR